MTFRGRPRGRPLSHSITKGDFSHDDLHSLLPHRRRIRDPRNQSRHARTGAQESAALLQRARLWFERYDDRGPVNQIDIWNDDLDDLAVWRDEDLRLRLAASDLLEAAELVVARWEQGDLADAVRQLDAAIAKAKGGSA